MTINLQVYPKYKDSSVEWAKNIPHDWDIKPLRYCCLENIRKNTTLSNTDILSLSYGNVILKDAAKNFGLVPENYSAYQILDPGDIVMRLTDLQNDHVSLRTGLVKNKGIITSAYLGLKVRKDIVNDRFFHWLLHSYDLLKVFYGMGGGIRQTVGFDELKWLPILVPNIKIQELVADFLDEKTKIFDDLVAKKEKMIELLLEKRAALITHIVTKGLNPKAKMKPSGVDWLGDIPEGWKVMKLKFLCSVQASNVDKIHNPGDQEVCLCNYIDVYKNEYITDKLNFMKSTATPEQINKLSVYEGVVLLTKDSETADDIGVPAYVQNIADVGSLVCGYHLYLVRTRHIDPRYLFRYLQSKNVRARFEVLANGVTRFGLSNYPLVNLEILIPPKNVQENIANLLDTETEIKDKVIGLIESQIDQLKEYRSSLIYSAVTGKIKI